MTFTITAHGLATGSLFLLGCAVVFGLLGYVLTPKAIDRDRPDAGTSASEWAYGVAACAAFIAVVLAFVVCGIVLWGTP